MIGNLLQVIQQPLLQQQPTRSVFTQIEDYKRASTCEMIIGSIMTHWTMLHVHLPTSKVYSYDSMPTHDTWRKVQISVQIFIPLLPTRMKIKWELLSKEDDYIKQYDSVSCRILMLWYLTKLSNQHK